MKKAKNKKKRKKVLRVVLKTKKRKTKPQVRRKKTAKLSFGAKKNIKKRKNVFEKNEMVLNNSTSKAIFRPKIKVIGIGGGGGAIVSEFKKSLKKASFVIADTDIRANKNKSGIKYFYFGEEVTHGLGTGMNLDLGREVAEKEREKIAKLMEEQDIVILVASLGGGVGSGATPIFAEESRKKGNVTLGIFTTPFKFEGRKKANISQGAIKKLRENLNAIITISNERIFKIIDEKTSISSAFSLVNKNLINSLESLIDIIYNPGLINIDFADLRTILKGRGMLAFLNTVEASGKNRAEKIIAKIIHNPLFNSNVEAEKILFNISGSNNLSMLEVEKISRQIAELNPKAKIIFGISQNLRRNNKIKTTILITGHSISVSSPKEKKSKEKKPTETAKKKIKTKESKKKPQKEQESNIISNINEPINIDLVSDKKEKKETIRRTALEIKKAQEIEEGKRLKQEEEWEIPTFLRKMKLKL